MAIFNLPMATLTDLDAPVITGTTVGTSTTIREDTGVGSYLTTFLTASPVASFAIVSNPGNLFAIAIDGGLTVSGALDYETASSHTLAITATDFVGLTSSPFTFTVNVLDLDENPPVLTLDTSATNLTQIDEYISQATLVATFDVVDNDTSSGRVATTSTPATTLAREFIPYITIGGETVPLSTIASVAETADITLSGDPGAQNFYTQWDFISSTNGKIQVYASAGGALAGGVTGDTDVTLTVGISDVAGNYGYADYTVTVIETPDPAVFGPAVLAKRTNTFRLQENTPNAQGQINQYEATGTVPHNWSVHGTDADKFTISSSGALSLVDPLDYEAQSSYSFTVRVTNYFYGDDGEIDQTYFDEEECTLTVINDTTDDPDYIDLSTITDYSPYSGFGFFNNDVYWAGLLQEAEDDWSLLPVRYNRALNTAETNGRNAELSISSLTGVQGFSVWSLVHDGKLLARYPRDYQNEDTLTTWGDLPSISTRSTISNNPSGYNPDRDGFIKTRHGGVVVDGRVWGRYRQGWFTAAQVWPWRDIEEVVVTTDGYWPTNSLAYAAQVGDYLYAVGREYGSGKFSGRNEVRVFHAPTRANRNNGLKFAYVGSTVLAEWTAPSQSLSNTGIAYDGNHIWVGRGSILLKFTAPPANDPLAPLVPAR